MKSPDILTRQPVPGVLNILGLQSDIVRHQIIQTISSAEAGVPFKDLMTLLRDRVTPSISDSSVSHFATGLENEDLIKREAKGTSTLFVKTELGVAADGALREYQGILIPALQTGLEEKLLQRLDQAGVAEVLRRTQRDAGLRSEEAVLEIASIQSNRKRLVLLCSLAADDSPIQFKDLKGKIEEFGGGMAQSTLSNLITGLVGKQLIRRAGEPTYSLTNLGMTSVRAFDAYQERVYPVLVDSIARRLS